MHNLKKVSFYLKGLFAIEGIKLGEITSIEYSDKLSWNTWGLCTRKKKVNHKTGEVDFTFKIQINSVLGLDENNICELEDCLLHEMMHTVEGCFNHGKEFKGVGSAFEKYGYHVSTYSNRKLNIRPLPNNCYIIKCKDCGKEYIYQRKSKPVKMVINGRGACICGGEFTVTRVKKGKRV